jgi:hypothetical protein
MLVTRSLRPRPTPLGGTCSVRTLLVRQRLISPTYSPCSLIHTTGGQGYKKVYARVDKLSNAPLEGNRPKAKRSTSDRGRLGERNDYDEALIMQLEPREKIRKEFQDGLDALELAGYGQGELRSKGERSGGKMD